MRIPWSRRGARAASTHFVKVRGDNVMRNGKTRYWYALPPKENLRNLLWHGRMNMWKYTSLRSIVTNQSSDLICGTICLKVNSLNFSCLTESFRTWRSKMGRNPPHPSLELWSTGCKTRFPCWSEVHILWPLSLTELSLLVPLRWKHPHKPGSARPKLYFIPFFYSLQDPTRYIWQKFPGCQKFY